MQIAPQLAKHFREVMYGGNWTSVNLQATLADVSWQEATAKIGNLNTIVALVYHINYYVRAIDKVLEGGPLDSKDKFSFDHPSVSNAEEWADLVNSVWKDADRLSSEITKLDESRLDTVFADEKYGSYYRNIQGLIEHTHYHLGQIVLIKKILRQSAQVV